MRHGARGGACIEAGQTICSILEYSLRSREGMQEMIASEIKEELIGLV